MHTYDRRVYGYRKMSFVHTLDIRGNVGCVPLWKEM